jgi:hypothetical protein
VVVLVVVMTVVVVSGGMVVVDCLIGSVKGMAFKLVSLLNNNKDCLLN